MREHRKLVVTSGSPLGVAEFYKVVMNHLKKLGVKLPYDPAIPSLGIYSEETKIEKDMCPSVRCRTIYNS